MNMEDAFITTITGITGITDITDITAIADFSQLLTAQLPDPPG